MVPGRFDLAIKNPNGTTGCNRSHILDGVQHFQSRLYPASRAVPVLSQTANPMHLRPTSLATSASRGQANHQYDVDDFFAAASAGNMPAVSYPKGRGLPGRARRLLEPAGRADLRSQTRSTSCSSCPSTRRWRSSSPGTIPTDGTTIRWARWSADRATSADVLTGPGHVGAARRQRAARAVRLRPAAAAARDLALREAELRRSHDYRFQSSILRFIEDTFGLGRIGGGSFDAEANSLNNLFDFSNPNPWKVLLDPSSGMVM